MSFFVENLDDPLFPLAQAQAQAQALIRRTGNFSAALMNHVAATMSSAACTTSSSSDAGCRDDGAAMRLKLVAMGAILVCGVAGVSIPLAGGKRRLLRTDSGAFFFAKAFAAGVILATGFVHMLPDGQEALSDPCLPKPPKPFEDFPVAGFVAMLASLGTLVLDFLATQFYERKHRKELQAAKPPFGGGGAAAAASCSDALVGNDACKEEIRVFVDVPAAATAAEADASDSPTGGKGRDPMHIVGMHAHAAAHRHSHAQGECESHAQSHPHSHGHADDSDSEDEPIGGGPSSTSTSTSTSASASASVRHVVVSQILELGIVSHSVIIGLSLGVSRSPCTIRPLLGALSFHQFFEGLALGGCISQAKFSAAVAGAMACFFAATTPGGVALGAALAKWSYDPRSPRALVVEGVLDCVSAGILIYMALVDLIAADFLSRRMRCDTRLQISSYLALFLGAASMSALAIWA